MRDLTKPLMFKSFSDFASEVDRQLNRTDEEMITIWTQSTFNPIQRSSADKRVDIPMQTILGEERHYGPGKDYSPSSLHIINYTNPLLSS